MMSVSPFIYKTNEEGEVEAFDNPQWQQINKEKKYFLNLQRSNIPKIYYTLKFEDYIGYDSKLELQKCIQYVQEDVYLNGTNSHLCLYLYGEQTSQKTTLACAMGKEFLKKGLIVQYMQASNLIDLLMKNSGFNFVPEIESILKRMYKADILIVDDVFDKNKVIYWNTHNKNLIIMEWDKFFRRYLGTGKRMILTSNIPLSRVGNEYGVSLYELLQRHFQCLYFKDSVTALRKKEIESKL